MDGMDFMDDVDCMDIARLFLLVGLFDEGFEAFYFAFLDEGGAVEEVVGGDEDDESVDDDDGVFFDDGGFLSGGDGEGGGRIGRMDGAADEGQNKGDEDGDEGDGQGYGKDGQEAAEWAVFGEFAGGVDDLERCEWHERLLSMVNG